MIIEGYGMPTKHTPGNVDDVYVDLQTGTSYRCTGAKHASNKYGFISVSDSKIATSEYEWVFDLVPPIIWDGNTEGLEVVDVGRLLGSDKQMLYYRVSPIAFAEELYTGASGVMTSGAYMGSGVLSADDGMTSLIEGLAYRYYIYCNSGDDNNIEWIMGDYIFVVYSEVVGVTRGVYIRQYDAMDTDHDNTLCHAIRITKSVPVT